MRRACLLAVLTLLACSDDTAPRPDSRPDSRRDLAIADTPVKPDAPTIDLARTDAVKVDASKADAARLDLAKIDATKIDATKIDATKIDATKIDGPSNPGVVKVIVAGTRLDVNPPGDGYIPVCASTGVGYLRGIGLDASDNPVQNAAFSYSSAKPGVLSVDAAGKLTGGTLSVPSTAEKVLVTVDAGGGIKATQEITVGPCPKPLVDYAGPFQVSNLSAGSAPVPGAELIHVQNPTQKTVANASGLATAYPPLPAGSLFTIKIRNPAIGSTLLDSYLTSTTTEVDVGAHTPAIPLIMVDGGSLTTLCGTTVDKAKGVVFVWDNKNPGGVKYFVSSPSAKTIYMNGATPDCSATSTHAQQTALIVNVELGLHWYLRKPGATVTHPATQTALIHLPAGNSVVVTY